MAYLVLARKHRPKNFEEITGQESVATTLKNAIASGRISHAYLFFGPRGVGKTTAARVLAKAVNCARGPTPAPCLACPSCLEIATGASLDVLEMDAASNTSVENIREAIIDTAALAPNRDRYKIFIIDEAHMLSGSAFNALLKTMEEPPEHVAFILATTEPNKIPATIFSRCQRFRFRPLPAATIAERLREVAQTEQAAATPEALGLLARAAAGSMRDGLSLLDQALSFAGGKLDAPAAAELLGLLPQELVNGMLQAVFAADAAGLWTRLQDAAREGYEPVQILKDLRETLEAVYLDRLGVLAAQEPWMASLAPDRSAQALAVLLKRLQRCLEEMRTSDSPRLTLELGLFGLLELPDLSDWVRRLEALEARAPDTPPPSPDALPSSTTPSQASPSPSAPPSRPFAEAWKNMLSQLEQEPVWGSLSQARAEFSEGRLILRFNAGFHLQQAKAAEEKIKRLLQAQGAAAAEIAYALDPRPPAAATEETGQAQRNPSADAEEPVELAAGDPLAEEPGIKRVLQVFPGKLRRVPPGQ